MQELKVMSYNIYVGGSGRKTPERRTPAVVSVIRSQLPDSFGVQEASESWRQRLAEVLPEYASVGLGREGSDKGEACPVFYLKDKFDLVRSETFWLSPTPEKPSLGWDARFNRVATIAVLRDKTTGATFSHMNTHFDHIGPVARLESAAMVCQKIDALDLPCVLTGDLNDVEESPMYHRLIEGGLRDTKNLAADADSGITFHGYKKIDKSNHKIIDFVLVNRFCQSVKSYRILRDKIGGIYPSDHFAVVATLMF